VGIFVLASSAPLGLYTAYCPLLMLFFLTKMTGIKITEEQSLKSRGEEYRRYQQTTSAFFPWFKKSPRR
jgi:steroid 5-alpha reductase family enzyme